MSTQVAPLSRLVCRKQSTLVPPEPKTKLACTVNFPGGWVNGNGPIIDVAAGVMAVDGNSFKVRSPSWRIRRNVLWRAYRKAQQLVPTSKRPGNKFYDICRQSQY